MQVKTKANEETIVHIRQFVYTDSSNSSSMNNSNNMINSSNSSPNSHGVHENGQQGEAENLAQDMNDLMHDFDVVSRMSSMIGTLRGEYKVRIGRYIWLGGRFVEHA